MLDSSEIMSSFTSAEFNGSQSPQSDGKPTRYVPWEPHKAAVSSSDKRSKNRRSTVKTDPSQKQTNGATNKQLHQVPVGSKSDVHEQKPKPYKIEPVIYRSKSNKELTIVPNQPVEDATSALPPADPVMESPKPQAHNDSVDSSAMYLAEIHKLQKTISEMKTNGEKLTVEKQALGDQLVVQNKVNAELKRLLVATMGDDLQTHVDCLSQDKVRLAKNIDHYNEKANAATEHVEQMAIDADLWRSKFLATSVMMDELVGWRVFLIEQCERSQLLLTALLQQNINDHTIMADVLRDLRSIASSIGCSSDVSPAQDMTSNELAREVAHLVGAVKRRLIATKSNAQTDTTVAQVTAHLTPVEMAARQAVQLDISQWYASSSSPCDEYRQCSSASRQARLLGVPTNCVYRNLTISCCKQCAGREIKLV